MDTEVRAGDEHAAIDRTNAAAPFPALEQITAVIVTYNSAHCAHDLGQQLRVWPHVLVVDNGSTDDTVAQFQQHLPQAQILAQSQNEGFGAANNRALEVVATPYAFLMNPDCVVLAADAQALWDSAQAWPDAAILVPQLTRAKGQLQVNYGWVRHWWDSKGPGASGPACVGNACGAAMLFRLSAMPTRQWFDTRFFLYYEDEDLCLRLLKDRRPVIIDPAVRVVHANRGSVRGPHPWRVEFFRGKHHAMSKVLFTAKHIGEQEARQQRRSALRNAMALFALRLLAPSPKHLCRLAGRISGLWQAAVRY